MTTKTDQGHASTPGYSPSYWGIYFLDIRRWLQKLDGEVVYYPSPVIAMAHLENYLRDGGVSESDIGNQSKVIVKGMT